jgi:hypothetical protein
MLAKRPEELARLAVNVTRYVAKFIQSVRMKPIPPATP